MLFVLWHDLETVSINQQKIFRPSATIVSKVSSKGNCNGLIEKISTATDASLSKSFCLKMSEWRNPVCKCFISQICSNVLSDRRVILQSRGFFCWVTEVNRGTCWSVEPPRLGGCAVCDCQGAQTERSVLSSSPLPC